jgi:DNA polymerase-3 subunit alpha
MHNDYADRKNARKPIAYLHPDAEEILGDTYGLMIYQESMMRIAQRFAGYSLAEADNLRKACLPAGTRVVTKARGYVPIESVMKLSDRRVLTIDETTANSRFEPIEDVWSVGVKRVFRLVTSTGHEIEATAEHPFLREDRWTPLGELRVGDLVAVASSVRTDGGARVSTAEVDLAALLISEGYTPRLDRPHGCAHFCNTDPELLETFRRAYEQFFCRPHRRTATSGGVTQLRLSNDELRTLEPLLGCLGLAADKVVPLRFQNAPRAKVERFLGLYFCADGWADRSGAHFASASRDVVRALKRMLLRCGIVSNVHHRDIAGHGRHYTVSIADKGQAKAFAQLVGPHLTERKYAKVQRWLAEWGTGRSATSIGIPASFVRSELLRRMARTGRSARDLGIDGNGLLGCRVVHRNTVEGWLYS